MRLPDGVTLEQVRIDRWMRIGESMEANKGLTKTMTLQALITMVILDDVEPDEILDLLALSDYNLTIAQAEELIRLMQRESHLLDVGVRNAMQVGQSLSYHLRGCALISKSYEA